MTVSLRNTPSIATQLGTSATISVAGTAWGTTPVAGDLLVAVFTITGNGTANLGSTPGGWTLSPVNVASATPDTRTVVFTKVAAGSDGVPTCAGTITSGTAARCAGTVVLYDFYDSSGITPYLATYGTAVGTSGTVAPVTSGTAIVSGSYAVASNAAQYTSTTTMTWTTPASWTSRGVSSTTTYYQYEHWSRANPTTGSTLTCSMAHSAGTTAYEAAMIAVIEPPISATVTMGSAVTVTTAAPAPTVTTFSPETSPSLELSGFGSFSAVGAADTIEYVQVTVAQFQSSALMAGPSVQLWDYSGTPAQIGATATGTATTSSGNADTFRFTGVSYSQLATLRVRIFANNGTATAGATQSVDSAGLAVCYSPAGAQGATVTMGSALAVTTTTPAPSFPWSLFGGQAPSGGSLFADAFTADLGIQFTVTGSGYLLAGYSFWLTPAASTTGSAYSFRLYSTTDGLTGSLITNSTVAGTGTWTAGAWNYCPLPVPVALTSGTTYVAAVSQAGGTSWYYLTPYYFYSGSGAAGITSGPVTAPDRTVALGHRQSPVNEPATGGMPAAGTFNYGNTWLDILVTQAVSTTVYPSVTDAVAMVVPPAFIGIGNAIAYPSPVAATTAQPACTVTVPVVLTAALAVAAAIPVPGVNLLLPSGNPSGGPWVLAFSDEFNDPKGTGKPDPLNWATCFISGDMWRNGSNPTELEWYPHNLQGTSVTGGTLVITATKTSPYTADPACPGPLPSGLTGTYVSGMISSHPSFRYTYGYAEARLQLPGSSVAGVWPAFWAISSDNNWPPEADVMEYKGGINNNANWWPPGGGASLFTNPNVDYTAWHTYGWRWTPTDVTFFFDGSSVGTVTTGLSSYPMVLMLQFAVSTSETGTGFPCSVTCDYIRVWQNAAAPAVPAITSITPSTGIPTAGTLQVAFSTVAGATSYRATSCTVDYYADVDQTYATESLPRAANTGTSSPVTISGLTNGVRYNATVAAYNSSTGLYSLESAVTPPLALTQTIFPSVVAVTTTRPAVTVTAGGNASVTMGSALAVTTARPAPVVRQDAAPAPAALAVVTARPAPGVSGSATVTALAVTSSRPAPALSGSLTAAILAVTTTEPVPTVNAAAILPYGNPPGGPWVLVFDEEFNDPHGTGQPDWTVWTDRLIYGTAFRCNDNMPNEIEWVPHDKSGTVVSGGTLSLIATSRGSVAGVQAIDPLCPANLPDAGAVPTFTSGMIQSHPGFQMSYGYFEARLQQPAAGWPAFWLYCANNAWPPEVDISEYGYPSTDSSWWPPGGGTDTVPAGISDGGWHVFGVRITPSAVTFYVDGSQTGSYSGSYGGLAPWVIQLNLAVQAGSGSSGYPCQLNADYVRAWTTTGVPAQPVITSITPSTGIPTAGTLQVAFAGSGTTYRVTPCPVDAYDYSAAWSGGAATVYASQTGSSSPITLTGLSNGVPYTATVAAINGTGYSIESLPAPAGVLNANALVVMSSAASVATAQPAVTVITSTGATVTMGSALAVSAAAPAPAAISGSLTASSPVAVTATQPAPAASGSATTAPATLAVSTSQPTATVTTSGNASVSPGTATASAGVPAPAVSGGLTAAALAVTTAMPALGVSGGLTAATLAASTAAAAPAAVSGGLTAGTLAVTAGITTPAVSAGGSASVTPAVLAVTANVPAPVVRQDQNVTASAAAVTTARPAPAVSGGLTLGSALAVSAGIATPAVTTSGNANASPAVTAAVVTIPAPVVRQDQSLIPAAVAVTVAVPAAAASGSARPPVAVITILAAFPATAASGGATLAPAVLAVSVSVPLPVPPFTVGTLTATDSAGAGGTLTASDTRTGGPS